MDLGRAGRRAREHRPMTSKDRAATESAVADRRGDEAGPAVARPGLRVALLALGWICVALGVVGMAIPGLPTTVFLIIALWAFSRSSHRFHDWLYAHPHLGPPLRAWHAHGVQL